MNIPSLPTDNLYKFIAIFGLILTLYSGYLYYRIYSDREQQNIDILRNGKELMVQYDDYIDLFDSKVGSIQEFYDSNLDTLNFGNPANGNHIAKSGQKISALEKWRIKEQDRLKELRNIYESKADDIENNSFMYYLTVIFLSAMLFGGIYLVKYGFENWYEKHQIYIDAEMKYRGMEFIEKLKEMEPNEKAKKESDSQNQEPETESDS